MADLGGGRRKESHAQLHVVATIIIIIAVVGNAELSLSLLLAFYSTTDRGVKVSSDMLA